MGLTRTTPTVTGGTGARECFAVSSGLINTGGTFVFFGQKPAVNQTNIAYGYGNVLGTHSSDILLSGDAVNSADYRISHGNLITAPLLHNYNCIANGATNQYTITGNNKTGAASYYFGTPSTPTLNVTELTVGAKWTTSAAGALNFYTSGNISEIVYYSTKLSVSDRLKLSSYLAIKHGITLDNSAGGDNGNYIATNASAIWTASVSSLYHNNVIGIGRDDNEALLQKQSKTIDDTVRIYRGSLNATNAGNTSTFTGTISYVMIGNKQGKVCGAFATNTEIPSSCGLVKRIEREWKVTVATFTQSFNMDIKLNGCAGTGSINVADLRLLVDDDGDFSNGGTNCYYNGDGTGILISYVSPVVTFSNITNTHIPNNATRYITLGSNSIATPLPIELVSFTNECDNTDNSTLLKWITATETNNDYFKIDRSKDAMNWQTIATVNGAGNSSTLQNYSFKDDTREFEIDANNISYYRLAQVDTDGTEHVFSNHIISADLCDVFTPNPASDKIYIQNHSRFKAYDIIDQLGQIVKQGDVQSNSIWLTNMSNGVYHIRLTGKDDKIIVRKLVIEKP